MTMPLRAFRPAAGFSGDARQERFRRLQGAALPPVRVVAEVLLVAGTVGAVGPLAELAADEPPVGAGRGLIDARNAVAPDAARTGTFHLGLNCR